MPPLGLPAGVDSIEQRSAVIRSAHVRGQARGRGGVIDAAAVSLLQTFAEIAAARSDCPSKAEGG